MCAFEEQGSDGSWTRNEYVVSPSEYIKRGLYNEPAWTNKKLPRQCGTAYPAPLQYSSGYKWEPLYSAAKGVHKGNLKLAQVTGDDIKLSAHASFLSSLLGDNFFPGALGDRWFSF